MSDEARGGGGSRRSTLHLYSDDSGLDSHRVRLILAEKGLRTEVESVAPEAPPAALERHGTGGELPVLLDRDLALHGVHVITDYLDERYPHPPFMPMDPVSRARTRLALHRIERDWYTLVPEAGRDGGPDARRGDADGDPGAARQRAARLRAALAGADEVFAAMPFFLSGSWSVLDSAVAPLLWRLPHYGIVLPETAGAVADYARRMFARPAFRASLSPREREMAQFR